MNVPVMLRQLWIQVTADRRRFGLLCAVFMVGLLLWARLIVITNTPRTAVADPEAKRQASVPPTTRADRPGAGRASDTRRGRDKPVPIVLSRLPSRDPFVISREHYPIPGFGDEQHKSAGHRAEDDPEYQEAQRLTQLRQLLGRLRLEAVMTGASLVVINSRTYRLGDEIPVPGYEDIRFRLVQVKERSVVLEFQGRRFEKVIATPGL